MKNIFKYIFGAVVLGLMSACSPEKFVGADPNGIPSLDGVEPVITVDQTINQVTFTLPADMKGVMPLWIIYENKGTAKEKVIYSTVNGLQKIYAKAGDYEIYMKLMNRNGISDGMVSKTFHIDNSIISFDKYITQMCGGKENSFKEWRINNDKQGHLGCGPSGTTGLEWWSAVPNDKKDWFLYDNRLTFGSDYSYKFDPGAGGKIYVNKGVTALGGGPSLTDDFNVAAETETVKFEFDVDGDNLYLVLPAHTNFPYICNDQIWNAPRYKVESIDGSEINLVADNGEIAWHYILTSGAATSVFSGYKYNSDFNLWRTLVDEPSDFTTHFYYAPGWNQIADPGFAKNDAEYTFNLPEATSDQWQAQCAIKPGNLALSAAKKYDFSCILNSSTDIKGVTIKLTDIATGDNFVFVERVDLKAYEDKVFYISNVNNLKSDANCELFFDFGGNPANTAVTIKNIVVKDNANDDGTVLPSDQPTDEPKFDWDINSTSNLWKSVEDGSAFISVTPWFADGGWTQVADPAWTHEADVWTVPIAHESSGQWQAQFPINTTLTALASKSYNFYCILEADNDVTGVTVKLTETNDPDGTKHDDNFFFADRHDLKAFTPFIYKASGVTLAKADAHALSLFFDFGGTPMGTNIKISKIYFEEVK